MLLCFLHIRTIIYDEFVPQKRRGHSSSLIVIFGTFTAAYLSINTNLLAGQLNFAP
jgi:hypothetical protein